MRYGPKAIVFHILRMFGISPQDPYEGYVTPEPMPYISPQTAQEPIEPGGFFYHCWECGEKITAGTNFCPKCGCDVSVDVEDDSPCQQEGHFCTKCGNRLQSGVKFCGKCGHPAGEPERADTKGGVQKCPSCGRALASFVTHCPACDYEIRGAGANSAVREFYERFSKASTLQMRMSIIRNFPVPNTKEDITEFMLLACSNFDAMYYAAHLEEEDVSDAWLAKIEQCYQKARIAINSEIDLLKIQRLYDEIQEKIAKAGKGSRQSFSKEVLIRSAGFLLGVMFFLISVLVERAGGFGGLWDLLGAVFLIVSGSLLARKSTRLYEYIVAAVSIVLSFVLASFLENGVIQQLGAGVLIVLASIFFFRSLAKRK